MACTIVIPSAGRVGRVSTLAILPEAELVVPEREALAYAEAYPSVRVVAHPPSVRGTAAAKAWVIREYGDVFIIDDDVSQVRRNDAAPGEARTIEGPALVGVIQRNHAMTRDLGIYLWSFSHATNPLHYRPQRPYELPVFVPGQAFGHVAGSGLWVPDSLVMNEDIWLTLLNAHLHRITLQDMRFTAVRDQKVPNLGGNARVRTQRSMDRDWELIREAFGEDVIRQDRTKGDAFGAMFTVQKPW